NATAYLIDPSKIAFGSGIGAISTSLLFLFGSYFIYEVIVRSHLGKNAFVFSSTIFTLLIIATWGSYQLFSDRASFIHIGAILGTVMAGNVFFGIMPAQRALVDCVRRGEKPGKEVADLALQAKNRSLMNNYFTLPLIFTMISNHYPMMYSHEHGWLILVFVGIITALVRHYFNQKHLGNTQTKFLWIPALLTLLLIIWMRPAPIKPLPAATAPVAAAPAVTDSTPPTASTDTEVENAAAVDTTSTTDSANDSSAAETVPVTASADDAIMAVVHTRCSTCHAVQ
ncbi:urate hydroxylase PuuD, partial [Psychrobacter sp. 1U2]